MIMSVMKLPCPSCLIDQKKNATDGNTSPGIQGSMDKAQKLLIVESKQGENHVPNSTSDCTSGNVVERIRIAVAKKARTVPLFDSAVRGPPMETGFKKARAHPWRDVGNY